VGGKRALARCFFALANPARLIHDAAQAYPVAKKHGKMLRWVSRGGLNSGHSNMGNNIFMTHSSTSALKMGFSLGIAILLAAFATTGSFAQTSAKTNSTPKITAPVDVNSADLKTLETLPGVGPSIAKKIVDGRPYKTLADLQKIKGLGKSRVDAMKDLVTFGPATADTSTNTVAAVPAKKPKKPAATTASTSSSSSTPAASSSSGAGSSHSSGGLAVGEKVNINTATAVELDKIPGIGPTKAQAIVDYRTQNGNFTSIEDIQKVKGIKSGVFSKIKDSIKVSD
jgi:comEA protein